jgi:hypothetical protein
MLDPFTNLWTCFGNVCTSSGLEQSCKFLKERRAANLDHMNLGERVGNYDYSGAEN